MARTDGTGGHLFVVERYLPDVTTELVARRELEGLRVARTANGETVRHRESIWIPADETVLSTFIADSREAVAEALRAGGVPADRIVEAVSFRARQPPAVAKELDDEQEP